MIDTPRLVLRRWQPGDRAALRAQSADPAVMRFLLPIDDDAAFEAMLDRLDAWQRDDGFTFWVIERRDDRAVLGLCGLKRGPAGTPISGAVEIGWRLGSTYWNRGYAREAAQACLDWAWANTAADEIVAITAPANRASWGLMERLGMCRDPAGDFDHPLVPDGSPLKRHLLYRIARR